ncbi:hypothetical protein V1511DRAFT_457879 [Dipodascopsis uninucleata]
MRNTKSDSEDLNYTIKRIEGCNFSSISKLYESMQPVSDSSIWRDYDVLCRAFIAKFVSCMQHDEAIKVWDDMQRAKVLPNPSSKTVNAYLMAVGRRIQKDTARRDKLELVDKCFKDISDKFKIDAVTYSILLDLYFRIGREDKASALFGSIEQGEIALPSGVIKPGVGMYDTMIKWYTKNGDITKAEAVFDKAKSRNIQFDSKPYNCFLGYYVRQQDYAKAMEWVNRLDTDNIARDAVTYAAILYATFHKLFLEIKDITENGSNYADATYGVNKQNHSVENLVSAGKKALTEVLQEMKDKSVPFTPHILHTMVVGLIDISNDMYLADYLFMTGARLVPVPRKTVMAVLRGHIEKGSSQRAASMFSDLLPRMNISRGRMLWNDVILRLCQEGDVEKAFDIYQKMNSGPPEGCDRPPNGRTYSILFSTTSRSEKYWNITNQILRDMEKARFIPESSQFRDGIIQYKKAGGSVSQHYLDSIKSAR